MQLTYNLACACSESIIVVVGCVVWYAWCLQWKHYVIDLVLVLLLSTLSLIHTLLCCSCCWLCIGKLQLSEDCTFLSMIFFLKKVFRIIYYEFHLKWKFKKYFIMHISEGDLSNSNVAADFILYLLICKWFGYMIWVSCTGQKQQKKQIQK